MWYRLSLLTGFILLAVSFYNLEQSLSFIGRSERATGTVTSFEEVDGAFAPVFTITTKDDSQIIYHHASASNPAAWDIGETAIFLYDPQNPGSARMMKYFWLFSWTIVFMAMAIPLLFIGGGYILFNRLTKWEPDYRKN